MAKTSSSAGELAGERPHPRYPAAAKVEISTGGPEAAMAAVLHNISLSGCYVMTAQTVAENTRVRVILHSERMKAELWGVVRRHDPTGLGIQFTHGATVEDWKALQTIIGELAAESGRRAQATCAGCD